MAFIYILHFDKPVWGSSRHYIGYTELPVERRLEQHKSGHGSRICKKALKLGIDFQLVHTEFFTSWNDAVRREREIKRKGLAGGGLCPVCNK